MNALAGNFITSGAFSGEKARIRVSVTHSGFSIVSEPASRLHFANLAEILFKLTGALLIPAGGIVLLFETLFASELPQSQLAWAGHFALLATFVFCGVALHRWANRGFQQRVQVDAVREEVRIGTVNIGGDFTLSATYPVSRIESFFILRSSRPGAPGSLRMRLKAGSQTIKIVDGTEPNLLPILERITLALKPPSMRNRRIRTKTTGKFIRMSFG